MHPLEHPDKPLNDVPQEQPAIPKQAPAADIAPVATPVSVPEPSHAHDYTRPIADTPKKTYHPKRFVVALSIFVAVCLLAVAAMVVIALLPMQQSGKPEAPSNTATQPNEKTLSARQAIAHVKEYFKADGKARNGISMPVRATGKSFYTVIPEASATVSVAGEVAPDKVQQQRVSIIHSLEGDGFVQRTTGYEPERSNYLGSFARKETVCQVEVDPPVGAAVNHWVEVRCADMATYEAYAKAQEPLVSLYTPLSATSVVYGFIGKPAPVVSKTAGYHTAEIPVSSVVDDTMTSYGTLALFYQAPSGVWTYWRDRNAEAVFACDQYDTNELKNAYYGTSCRDTSKNTLSTVPAPRK